MKSKKFSILIVIFLLLPSISKATDTLLQPTDFKYIGAFRVPKGDMGGPQYHGLSYGGESITYNNINNSLFITGTNNDNLVAEISIPAIVNSTEISDLNTASVIQNLYDITEGNSYYIKAERTEVVGNRVYLGGLLKYGNNLIGSVYHYYDGDSEAIYSHFKSGLTLSTTGDFLGMVEVGSKPSPVPQAGFVAGYMTTIPSTWQAALGGTALTGAGGYSVSSRISFGPALFAFNPSNLNMDTPAPAVPLVYYNLTSENCVDNGLGGNTCDNQNLGGYYNQSTTYKMGTSYRGAVFPSGSRSVIVTGKYGTGATCYGLGNTNGTAGGETRTTTVSNAEVLAWMNAHSTDTYPCGTGEMTRDYTDGTGHQCCYDPTGASPGAHAYPYVIYAWAYDADDLVRIKRGGRIVDDPSPNLATAIVEDGKTYRPGVSPTSTETYKPWHIKPYAKWEIPSPFTQLGFSVISGASAYDEATKRLYVVQVQSDEMYPIVLVFDVNLEQKQAPYIKNILNK